MPYHSVQALATGQKEHATYKHHKILFRTVLCILETCQQRKNVNYFILNGIPQRKYLN